MDRNDFDHDEGPGLMAMLPTAALAGLAMWVAIIDAALTVAGWLLP